MREVISDFISDFFCLKLREVICEILFKLREVISDFYI